MRFWLLIFVACSGGSTTSDDAAEQTLVKMAEFRDRACACTEVRCTSKVLDDISKWARDPSRVKGEATADQRARLAKIRAELDACEKKLAGTGPKIDSAPLLAEAAAARDKMCACTDRGCVDKVSAEMAEVWKKLNASGFDRTMTADQKTQIQATMAEFAKCADKAAPPH